ncbi:hypothetical protein, partial [Pantoea agglomerans]|uniref:hypothetical protein n=1 Tax=Enterobacter agglomerans TaxID=549 RepID=UPI003CF7F49E
GTLVVVGVRQRSGQSVPWPLMIGTGSVVAVGGIYAAMTHDQSLQGMIVPGYVGILMLCSAAALWPRERRFNAQEMAFFTMFLLFALFEAALVV